MKKRIKALIKKLKSGQYDPEAVLTEYNSIINSKMPAKQFTRYMGYFAQLADLTKHIFISKPSVGGPVTLRSIRKHNFSDN